MKWILLIIVIGLWPFISFLKPGLPITHDGPDHVARIASFYLSLSEGNLIPRWAGNLNWGYGHPVFMFFYPLSSYFGSIFHFLGFSFINSTKLVFITSFIFSGIFMFLWVKEMFGREAGVVAAIVYMYAPYHLVDIFVRGAIGENLALVWPPLIMYFALKNKFLGFSFALALLILSHNAVSLMFLPVIMAYVIFLNKNKLRFVLAFISAFAMSAFFWMPAIFEAKYTLRDIVNNSITGFSNIPFNTNLGLLWWLTIALSPLVIWKYRKKKNKIWMWLSIMAVVFGIAFLMTQPITEPIYNQIKLLQKFQFAWRFLSLAIFPPAVFIGALIYLIPKKIQIWVTFISIAVLIYISKSYWQIEKYLNKSDSDYLTAQATSTNDTGESSPIWSIRRMEEFPNQTIETPDAQLTVLRESRKTTNHQYQIKIDKPSLLVENTLYFPGWEVKVNDQIVPIEYQNQNHRGLITFNVPAGEHKVEINFKETKLRQIANIISGSAVVLSILVYNIRRKLWIS